MFLKKGHSQFKGDHLGCERVKKGQYPPPKI